MTGTSVSLLNSFVFLYLIMTKSDPGQSCFACPLKTVNRKMIAIMIILLIAILSPRMARAGVIIEQRITVGAPGAHGSVRTRTLMLQDDKEKFQVDDHVSVVIDASNRIATLLDSGHKTFRELPFNRARGTSLDPDRPLYMPFKSTDKTRELLGFKCRDYTGARYGGPLMAATTACFSTDAAGSDEFTHFMQSMLRRSGKSGGAISFPIGVPLIVESTRGVNPSFVVPQMLRRRMQPDSKVESRSTAADHAGGGDEDHL